MHFDNLLFVLLGLAFVVLRWLARRATNSDEPRSPQQGEQPTRPPAESEEERVRRFMEALGNPVGSKPPPKVTPRPVTSSGPPPKTTEAQRKMQRRTVLTPPLPPLTTIPPPPAVKRVVVPQPVKAAPISRREPTPARVQPAVVAPAASPQFASLLRSPDDVRKAMILREILGAPRAFEPLDRF